MDILTNLALFAGAGGLELGARKCGGFRTVGYVERDRYAQGVIMSRIRGGELDDAPIWDDVTTFDGRPWRGLVDVVSGGFPCQDVSRASVGAGITGQRSGLYGHQLRIVREVGAKFALLENVAGLFDDGGIGVVLGDLAELGFDARWSRVSACAVGAPHPRDRVFILAYPRGLGFDWRDAVGSCGGNFEDRSLVSEIWRKDWDIPQPNRPSARTRVWSGKAPWESEPRINRVAYGVANQVDRIRLCGNGVVPDQSVPAWALIKKIAETLAVKDY